MLFDKKWYGFPAFTVNLFVKAYHKITYKEDLKSHVSLRWYAFLCGFGSDVFFTIDHFRSISFFCQNAHHDWLTKEYISNWFLVIVGLEPTTLGLRVPCSTDWDSRADNRPKSVCVFLFSIFVFVCLFVCFLIERGPKCLKTIVDVNPHNPNEKILFYIQLNITRFFFISQTKLEMAVLTIKIWL